MADNTERAKIRKIEAVHDNEYVLSFCPHDLLSLCLHVP